MPFTAKTCATTFIALLPPAPRPVTGANSRKCKNEAEHEELSIVTTGPDEVPGINGGISLGPKDYPHGIRITIEVDSIDEVIARAVGQGAQIVREKMEFDDFYLAYLADPVGLGIGLIQQKK